MKLATYELGGRSEIGIVEGEEMIRLSPALPAQVRSMSDLIRALSLAEIKDQADGSERVPLSALAFDVPVPDPGKIVCVGLNYEDHRKETGRPKTAAPSLFLRLPTSHVGHDIEIRKPSFSDELDFEGEIAVIIGKPGRDVSETQAYDHVFGYSCYNDVSVRDWQRHTTQWTPGKNMDGVGSFGPWIVTSDELGPAPDVRLVTRLNGEVMQEARSSQMNTSIQELIAYVSRFSRLNAGDVIVTGTPGGVGARRDPKLFMKPGDIVEVDVESVGILRNPIT